MSRKVRYAVMGLGHLTQTAILPAFANASKNSVLTALIGHSGKRHVVDELGKYYGLDHLYTDDEMDRAFREDTFDALYIVLPNHLHKKYCIMAAECGIHVLCEKPLGLDQEECLQMIAACERNKVKLMTAYRLHFEATNMQVVHDIGLGKIGTPRLFTADLSQMLVEGNYRGDRTRGGGPLLDIGIYCINAARYIFKSEPKMVTALAVSAEATEPRVASNAESNIDQSVAAVMEFDGGGLATFNTSFGASRENWYQVVGTEGSIKVDPAFDYACQLSSTLKMNNGDVKTTNTPLQDHFAPELIHFSDCIINDTRPGPDGHEGLADAIIIDAINESLRTRKAVRLPEIVSVTPDPGPDLVIQRPAPDTDQIPLIDIKAGST
jgi:predicted dehydrogenase